MNISPPSLSPPQLLVEKRVPDFHPLSPTKSHEDSADNLLDFYLGEDNNSSSPKPSPPKTAPPAPPGATICMYISYCKFRKDCIHFVILY